MLNDLNKPRVINLVQNSQDWHDFRRDKIGASDIAAIMGVSPWVTPLQLWENKCLTQDRAPSPAMMRGARLEEAARSWYNACNPHCILYFKPAVLQHHTIDWAICSLDAFYKHERSDGSYFYEIAELKCPGTEAHLIALDGQVPPYYIPQLMWQMWIAQVDEMDYVSFDGVDGKIINVKFDKDYFDNKLFPAVLAFKQLIDDFVPPEPSDMDAHKIVDPRSKELAMEYMKLQKQIDALELKKEMTKQELLKMAKGRKSICGNLKMVKVFKKGNIDYASIPALKGMNLDGYRKKATEYWKLSAIEYRGEEE